MKLFTVLLFAVALSSCQQQHPAVRILDRTTFAGVYAELLYSAQMVKQAGVDSAAAARGADSVLVHHGVTRDEVIATLQWYNADAERWKPFFEEVTRIMEEKAKEQSTGH